MDCETFREHLAGDPADADAGFERHARTCSPCRAFHERMLRMEPLIGRALRFDVGAVAGSRQRHPTAHVSGWVTLTAGLAAAVVAGLNFWAFADDGAGPAPARLADAIVAHWDHEPASLARTDVEVPRAALAGLLYGTGELRLAADRPVSYARICRVAGRFVPHLVVQGESGPYMVILLPGRFLESSVPLESQDRGLAGHILPVGSGSIAVFGNESEELEEMESLVADAVAWAI